jgi:haloalkane dehalogenase
MWNCSTKAAGKVASIAIRSISSERATAAEFSVIELKDETWAGSWPFAPHYYVNQGVQLHYVDEGQGEPIVLVHGDPTWGYLYRQFIPSLAQQRRCIVPDHMGMGKSSVPATPYPYRLQHHIANFEALMLYLDIRDMTLVLHDWGGPVGLGFAVRHPARIKRLVLMNTWAFAPWPGGPLPRLLEIIRSERGDKFVLERHGYLEPALRGTTYHTERLTTTVMDAYRAPFPTPASRLALLCWSRDIPAHVADPSYAVMRQIESDLAQFASIPILLLWGMRDPVLGTPVLHQWQDVFPQAQTHVVEDASHFVPEDAPERLVVWIETFLAAHP